MFWDSNYLMKMLLNYAFEMTKSQPIVKKTLYQIMFDNRDPFLEMAHLTMPSIAMHQNVGLIPMVSQSEKMIPFIYMEKLRSIQGIVTP